MSAPLTQDEFFTRVFQEGLSNPNSKAYLPGIILSSKSPALEPYTLDEINLGKQKFDGGGLSFEVTVVLKKVEHSGPSIGGLANISVASAAGGSLALTGLTTDFVAQFSKVTPPPKNVPGTLVLDSDFTLSSETAGSVSGHMTLDIKASSLSGQFVIGGSNFDDITVTFSKDSLKVSVPTSSGNITPKVVFDGGGGFWGALFETYIKKPETINSVLTKINSSVNGELAQISSEITKIVRENLKSQLGSLAG